MQRHEIHDVLGVIGHAEAGHVTSMFCLGRPQTVSAVLCYFDHLQTVACEHEHAGSTASHNTFFFIFLFFPKICYK